MLLPSIPRLFLCLGTALTVAAQSNFDPDHSLLNVDSIGALQWSPAIELAASINQYYASGYIYAANIGWISLGAAPLDKLQYRNNSAEDFGVNVNSSGALRGYAYGANVGWINFEPVGNPRVDWISGRLAGRVWSPNLGWINLENSPDFLRLSSLPEPADEDSDGIADSWEMLHAANLTSFSAQNDADADGLSDLQEFLAGTDPLDPADSLSVTVRPSLSPRGTVLEWPTKAGYLYFIDQREAFRTSADWTVASEKLAGTGSTATLNLPFTTTQTFYRVRAYPPLSAP